MRLGSLAWLLLLGMLVGCGKPASYEDGLKALNAGDIHAAYRIFQGLPADSRAITHQAIAHLKGRGANRDEEEAAELFQKAARMGNARAQFILSTLYERGIGLPKDRDQQIHWLTKAASQGNTSAQIKLGSEYESNYENGGSRDNLTIADYWYAKAYEYGDASSLTFLTGLYIRYSDLRSPENVRNYYVWTYLNNAIKPNDNTRAMLESVEEELASRPPQELREAKNLALAQLARFGSKPPPKDDE
ncbi:tetratricopeptide repeat protein [Pseudomonas aeruginosa]